MINVTYSTRNVFLQDGTYVTYCASVNRLIEAVVQNTSKVYNEQLNKCDSAICFGNVVWSKCEEG